MAIKEECVFCSKYRQGAYGAKCSYLGRKPVFDGTSCTHHDGEIPSSVDISTITTKPEKKIEQKKENTTTEKQVDLSKNINFFDFPWWSMGGGGVVLLILGRVFLRAAARGKDFYSVLSYILMFLGIAAFIASIYLLVAFWKFRSATKIHKEFFPFIISSKLSAISLLFWLKLGALVCSLVVTILAFVGYEWLLMEVLYYFSGLMLVFCIIVAGVGFNKFERKNFKKNDNFGSWLIGYGGVFLVLLILPLILSGGSDLMFYMIFNIGVLTLISLIIDFLYAYNISKYSKETIPILFKMLDDKSTTSAFKQDETTSLVES